MKSWAVQKGPSYDQHDKRVIDEMPDSVKGLSNPKAAKEAGKYKRMPSAKGDKAATSATALSEETLRPAGALSMPKAKKSCFQQHSLRSWRPWLTPPRPILMTGLTNSNTMVTESFHALMARA